MKYRIVVPWHNPDQRDKFLAAWNVRSQPHFLILQHDAHGEGCATTKNKGIRRAIDEGAEMIVVLDDDCFPHEEAPMLEDLAECHRVALEPKPVEMFRAVTDPPSRGTPYHCRRLSMPVAASMGFWSGIGDYDAPGQLVHGATHPMTFYRGTVYGQYFPLCGMNLAFCPEWWPWCRFIDVPRFDDIWQGFLWQKRAFADGYCFNLGGPMVTHSRQSNVWQNLRDEAQNLERNETIWHQIHHHPSLEYDALAELTQAR